MDRTRMIFDVTPDVQMAIKLRAVKTGTTTGEAVAEAIRATFPADIEEARKALAELKRA